MKFARLDVRFARLRLEDESTTGDQCRIYALEKALQACVATIQMNPLRYREPRRGPPLILLSIFFFFSYAGKVVVSLRDDDVVARLVFGDALVHPVSTTEGHVMRKRALGDVQVE
jgi:hypothetical protein